MNKMTYVQNEPRRVLHKYFISEAGRRRRSSGGAMDALTASNFVINVLNMYWNFMRSILCVAHNHRTFFKIFFVEHLLWGAFKLISSLITA